MSVPFRKSPACAAKGVWRCLKRERNMRIHLSAAAYVLFFSPFFGFSRGEQGLLFLTIGAVLAAELFNTAAEELCDFVSPGYAKQIGCVKDLAAGGVLVCALAAACVGLCLFWRPDKLAALWAWFWEEPLRLAAFLCTLPAAACFVALPGRKEKKQRNYEKRG